MKVFQYAQQVWNIMKKKPLDCYHDTNLKTNVLLLADVFEVFRNTCLKNCKLDLAHFYTATGLAWQALLKTAAENCEHEKGIKSVNYAPTSLGLSCL